MDPQLGTRRDIDILIERDTITSVGQEIEDPRAEHIDCSDMILLPGLVNAHMHTWQTAIRGIAGDWSLFDYGRHIHTGIATRYTPEDIYVSNLVGALNQINSGVTTLFDWCHNNPTPAHSDRAIDALQEAGIRAVFGHGTPKPKLNEAGVPTQETLHPEDEVRRIREERLDGDSRLVTMALCIRGPDLAGFEACVHDIELARKYDLVASMHIGGRTRANRKTPDGISRLSAAGLLDENINAVHGNKLSDDELRILADAGASFTTTPEVEMQMGHGMPIAGRLLPLGRDPSIGIDIESNIGSELLWATRFALQLQRGMVNVATNEGGREVGSLSSTTAQALRWATIEGAKALRMESSIGSISPGKQADIIMFRRSDLNLFPTHDPEQAVLFQSNSSNVDSVLVAGQFVKRAGKLTFRGLDALKDRLYETGERLIRQQKTA